MQYLLVIFLCFFDKQQDFLLIVVSSLFLYNFEHFHHLTDGGLPGLPVDSGGRCSARKQYPVDITFSVISHTLYMQNSSNRKGSLHTFYTDKYLRIFCLYTGTWSL